MHAVLTKLDISPFSLNACPQPFIAGGRIGTEGAEAEAILLA